MKYFQNMGRVEAFSDAVFAIAATLLVISLGYGESSSVIKIHWLVFLGFGISFFALVRFWWLHYNCFKRANYIDNWIIDLLFYARHFAIFVLVSCASIILAKLRIGLEWALSGIIYMILGSLCYVHGDYFYNKIESNIS